ncbi:MAG: UDP-N-acetylmuramyl-tripeptide synthetase [Verrucomicrobiales bacterium]|nr:UDP-N-acetylmuramyl-tripeptide synthetase [Verrucomicrobiales bacterium]
MKLNFLLDQLFRVRTFGPLDVEVTGLTADSRQAGPGILFAALRGETSDGHNFISQAIANGAAAILAETDVPTDYRGTWITVKDTKAALAEAADAFFRKPSDRLPIVGVTGTNGKTTTCFLLQHIITSARGQCGLIGTVKYVVGEGLEETASHTTPDSITLQRLLRTMTENHCTAAAIEVSSHALMQQRTHGIRFDAAVFTNLTQDHLDYHKTMEAYYDAKARFAEHLVLQGGEKKPALVLNTDDAAGRRMAREYEGKLRIVTYGMNVHADFRATQLTATMRGTTFTLEARGRSFLVRMPLIGKFNVYNALGALAAVWSMDLNLRQAVKALEDSPQVPGRMESVSDNKPFRVFIDYAHTPDALENALRTLRDLSPRRIITVFGCGGDRDRTKRPRMGAVAEAGGSYTILTNDNPRSEDPDAIMAEIKAGMRGETNEMIPDRRAAIERAISIAGGGDIVLIAGKGHESGQTVNGVVTPFDDVQVTRHILRNWTLPERP